MTTSSSQEDGDNLSIEGVRFTSADDVRSRTGGTSASRMQGQSPDEPKVRGGSFSAYIDKIGFRPYVPSAVTLRLSGGQPDLTIPAGFYLLSGGTGGGKSITAASLLVQAASQEIPVRYIYCYEARTPMASSINGQLLPNPYFQTMETQAEMDDAERTLENFISKLPTATDSMSTNGTALVVIDSVALPMRAFQSKRRQNQATMKEGLQPMDIAFVVAMEDYAVRHSMAIFGVINDDLVPFAAKLEGMAEGMVTVHSAGYFSIRSRYDRRVHQVMLNPDAVDAAGEFLNYDVSNASTADRAQTIFGTDGL